MKLPNTNWAAILAVTKQVGTFVSFPNNERHPTVVHLVVYLKMARVYFRTQNALQRAIQTQSTTLTTFFYTCQNDDLAGTLLYSEIPKYYSLNQS